MPQSARSSVAAGRPAAAPGDLEKVRALVNSSDLEQGTDDLVTAAGLAGWLQRNGLAFAGDPGAISHTDLEQAVALREALRGVLRAHAAAPGAGPATRSPNCAGSRPAWPPGLRSAKTAGSGSRRPPRVCPGRSPGSCSSRRRRPPPAPGPGSRRARPTTASGRSTTGHRLAPAAGAACGCAAPGPSPAPTASARARRAARLPTAQLRSGQVRAGRGDPVVVEQRADRLALVDPPDGLGQCRGQRDDF